MTEAVPSSVQLGAALCRADASDRPSEKPVQLAIIERCGLSLGESDRSSSHLGRN